MRLRPTWLPALFALCAGAWQVSPARPQPIPARPELLRFAPFEVEFPGPERYRHAIGTDTIAYVVEDHRLPLVDLRVLLRIGAFLDPPGKDGLALMTLDLMRLGGPRAALRPSSRRLSPGSAPKSALRPATSTPPYACAA